MMLVIVVVSTGSGLLPTLESLLCLFVSSIRSCSPRLSSTRSAHSSLLHPFLFLLFTSHSLYLLCFFLLQLWHSPVLPSFLPASPSSCHFNAPSLFLSAASLFVFIHFAIFVRISNPAGRAAAPTRSLNF